MSIFVVIKPFKSYGIRYSAGQIISDPASIKRFKSKVVEGKIKVFSREDKNTVPAMRFLEKKLGVSILKEAKEFVAAYDAAQQEETEKEGE